MPWRQTPMKDVVHCEKSRGIVYRCYIREFPNGETHCGFMPQYSVLNT